MILLYLNRPLEGQKMSYEAVLFPENEIEKSGRNIYKESVRGGVRSPLFFAVFWLVGYLICLYVFGNHLHIIVIQSFKLFHLL